MLERRLNVRLWVTKGVELLIGWVWVWIGAAGAITAAAVVVVVVEIPNDVDISCCNIPSDVTHDNISETTKACRRGIGDLILWLWLWLVTSI